LQAITKLQIGGPTGTGTWEFITAFMSVSLNKKLTALLQTQAYMEVLDFCASYEDRFSYK
jgi:hypothetical protein